MFYRTRLQEKLDEALRAVIPIISIVLILSFTIAPINGSVLLAFLLGGVLLVAGMMFFNLGAELAMQPMGQQVGGRLTKTKKLGIILPICFLLGSLITISEPDLQVLAGQVQSIPNLTLILSVAFGVGLFLVLALLRMLFGIRLRTLLILFYSAVILLAFVAPADFLAVAFDAGGVTTGPMTVPFILSFGLGISAIRSDGNARDDGFGLVALCSIGPILAVLILSMVFHADDADFALAAAPEFSNTVELRELFISAIPTYLREITGALLPIVLFFAVFQLSGLRTERQNLRRIGIGLLYTYVGLVLFLTGVNVGFMPAGTTLGETLAGLPFRWILIPIGMLIGFYIVKAEPAVYVLMKQVEELTNGAVTGTALLTSLSAGVCLSVGLSMLRVLTGISILYLIIPGYALALVLTFFAPEIFTAIAFDSGGVASGPMTATFLLPLATGACTALGGNVVTDAFGVISMVAMTPLISIQLLGVTYKRKERQAREAAASSAVSEKLDWFDDYEIIVL